MLPAGLCDDHLRPVLVELLPQLPVLQRHLGVVLDVVVLRRGRRAERKPAEREAGKVAWIAIGRAEGVGGTEGREHAPHGGGWEGVARKEAAQVGAGQERRGEGHGGARQAGRHHGKT